MMNMKLLTGCLALLLLAAGSTAFAFPADGNDGPAQVLIVDPESYNANPEDIDSWEALHCRGNRNSGNYCIMRQYSIGKTKEGYEFTVHGYRSFSNGIFLQGIIDHGQVFLSRLSNSEHQFINCPTLPAGSSNSSICSLRACNTFSLGSPNCEGLESYLLMTNSTYQANETPYCCPTSSRCDPDSSCPCCDHDAYPCNFQNRCYGTIRYRQTPFVIRSLHFVDQPSRNAIPKVLNCKWTTDSSDNSETGSSDPAEVTGRTCRMVSDDDCNELQASHGLCKPQFFIMVPLRPYPKYCN